MDLNTITSLLSHMFHSINAATWLASIGTVGTLSLGLWQFVANSRRAANRDHRSQAMNVGAWVVKNGSTAWLAVHNQSNNPVYEIILTLVPFQGAGDKTGQKTPSQFRAFLSVLPPGRYFVKAEGFRGMSFHPGVKIVFVDAAGCAWAREGDGTLTEIDSKPVEYFNLSRPLNWTLPLDEISEE